jgi:formylglycine-generating enzyme required for sulfatase activity
MPNDEPEDQPRHANSVLNAFRNLPEDERAHLTSLLQPLGVSLVQFESLLQQAISVTNTSGGVTMQSGSVGGSVVGRDLVVNLNLSVNDRQTLQQVLPALANYPALRDPLYAALRAGERDLEDFTVLAHRLYDKPRPGSPVDVAKREQAVYVPLALKFSRHRRVSAQSPFEHDQTFDDISVAVEAARAAHEAEPYPALVLLGAPGGGKSTALRHLMLDRLDRLLSDAGAHLPLFVSLGDYRVEALSKLRRFLNEDDLPLNPLNFLRAHWHAWFGDDGFERALEAGRLWLILDDLNEIPNRDDRIPDWAVFFDEQIGLVAAPNRAVVACRRADYGNRLELPYLDLEELDWERIRDFVGKRLQKMGQDAIDDVLRRLQADVDLLEVVSNPFWLKMLTDYAEDHAGHLPEGRTDLIDWFVDKWLRYGQGRADLPPLPPEDIEALKSALEPFAYWMLDHSDNAPVERSEAVRCCGTWGKHEKNEVLQRAERASLLVHEATGVKFYHQLILEYFAGRKLALGFRHKDDLSAHWRIPWSAWQFVNTEWRRLSEPPTTRWEEATVFAAARSDVLDDNAFDQFVRAVLREHPPLAARCLLEAGRKVPDDLRQAVIDRLLAIVEQRDPALKAINPSSAQLSLRIAAGHALGKLGDPRIVNDKTRGRASLRGASLSDEAISAGENEIASRPSSPPLRGSAQDARNDESVTVEFIEPRWCPVPAGPFKMGDDASEFDDEKPEHTCDVIKRDYALGMFPVTNLEYNCFVKAGGYDNQDYWTPQGWLWRTQDIETAQPPSWIFWNRNWSRDNLDWIRQWPERGIGQPAEVEYREALAKQTDEELIDDWRNREIRLSRTRNPWRDDRDLNGANQPVVGVCWYEALAYCKWLTHVLRAAGRIRADQEVTLPNEPEWEKAARTSIPGPSPVDKKRSDRGREIDPDRANTLEGRVLTTTPVGTYDDNAGGCGALDLSGNVWEWTRSRWGDNPQQVTFGYPYSKDLAERERQDTDDYRVVRGGSWGFDQSSARVTSRLRSAPDNRDGNQGLRCVLRSIA